VDTGPPQVSCTEHTTFVEKEDITVECTVQASNIDINAGELVVMWRKVTKLLVKYNDKLFYEKQLKGRVQCFTMKVVLNKVFSPKS